MAIPIICNRDITLVTKPVNEVNEVLNCILVRSLLSQNLLQEQMHYWFEPTLFQKKHKNILGATDREKYY